MSLADPGQDILPVCNQEEERGTSWLQGEARLTAAKAKDQGVSDLKGQAASWTAIRGTCALERSGAGTRGGVARPVSGIRVLHLLMLPVPLAISFSISRFP